MNNEEKRLTLKDWAEENRPREKMLKQGACNLTDVELLAILLRSGSTTYTVVEIAQQLLNQVGNNLNELGKLNIHQLTKFKGIGPTKAVTVMAALELGRRRNISNAMDRMKIYSSVQAIEIMKPLLADLPHEEFWVILLSNSNKVIDKVLIGRGGTNQTIADPKILLKAAIENLASSIILVHNHPSGNPNPSQEDINLTQNIRNAAKMIGISLLDHIIITDNQCTSFADEGIL